MRDVEVGRKDLVLITRLLPYEMDPEKHAVSHHSCAVYTVMVII